VHRTETAAAILVPTVRPMPTDIEPDPVSLTAPTDLSAMERAVLVTLYEAAGRVVARRELARRAGIAGGHERRCDAALVGLRRVLGADAIVTVRSRGWMLHPDATARAGTALGQTTLLAD
jgi:DNA-binding response OmpR family regulator